jgi:hypothetical protein
MKNWTLKGSRHQKAGQLFFSSIRCGDLPASNGCGRQQGPSLCSKSHSLKLSQNQELGGLPGARREIADLLYLDVPEWTGSWGAVVVVQIRPRSWIPLPLPEWLGGGVVQGRKGALL